SRLLNFAAMRVRRLVWQAFPMNFGIQTNRSERVARREGAHSMRFAASSRTSLRYRTQYSRHSDEIRGGHRQLEVLIDLPDSPVDGLPDAPDRLAPAEVLLDALALDLTEPVALVTGRSAVDGAAPIPGVVVRHMRRHLPAAACVDEVARVVGLVGAHRPRTACRHRIEHRQRCGALAEPVGVRNERTDRQPRAV